MDSRKNTNMNSSTLNDTANDSLTNNKLDVPILDFDMEVNKTLFETYVIYNFVLDIVLIFPTIIGNSLIIVAIIRFPPLRQLKSHIMIANLAVSDLLIGLVVMPMDILMLMNRYVSSNLMYCLSYQCLVYTLLSASVLNLFQLSLERFHAIIYPFQHASRFTKSRMYSLIICTWIFVISFGFLPMFGLHIKNTSEYFLCSSSELYSTNYRRIFHIIIISSFVTSLVFFIIVVRVALSKVETSIKLGSNNVERRRIKRDIRHTRMMLLVSGVFVVFWTPYCIITLIPNPSPLIEFIRSWLATFGFINSCLNWVIYGARCRKFRQAFKSVLTCKCTSAEFHIHSASSGSS